MIVRLYKGGVLKGKIFYGWWIVFATFLGNFMATGTMFYSFNAFLQPLCETHNWSRTAVNIAPGIGTLIGIFSQVFYGWLVVRTGARRLMMLGGLVSGISFALLGRVESLGFFYFMYCLLVLSSAGFHGVVPNSAVSNWFERYRGRALGLSTAGVSLSGVLIPPLALFLLKKTDLSNAFLILGLMTWVLVIISAGIWVKNRPEDYGLSPDGVEREKGSEGMTSSGVLSGVDFKKLLGTQSFWMIGISFGLVMMGVVGVMIQLKPRFSDLGFSDNVAMLMMALTALLGTAGKYSWGRFCDSFDERRVIAVMIVFQVIGLILLLSGKFLVLLIGFMVLFGFGMGGVVSTFPIIVASFFGRENFAKVFGYISIFLALQGIGYIIMGRSFDLKGSYDYAYLAFIVLDMIALVLMLLAKKPSSSLSKNSGGFLKTPS